jgi:large subunit ribosomal protein L6|tara:strand:- start:26864 stop:27415 length:552 start_codon:yes stop_codon:yes gene_type:complete
MSRIGKAPVAIPEGVEIKVDGAIVTVKGKKGELKQAIDKDMSVKIEGGFLTLERPTEQKRHKALHGLYRSLINNMVTGVSEGYSKTLELVGVGFRASSSGQLLEMALGFSHPIVFLLPDEVKVEAIMEKGKPPRVVLNSNDKQLIGQIAARIRAVRKPEPYKGKGIRFAGEEVRRKEGKSAKK